ncbi:MAG TPA: metalloregulator ArsR/SmtB family transcription factor, partial [Pyrinomonadaceae bacterium]|nr:metalloregulator ArsR/SmtB family transcription factor [Pyrinomonadaceae bacterium]
MVKKLKSFDRELFFRALADPTRLRIINLIGDQEVCVCFFVEILNTNQPKISRHLAYLRRAGIVAARREGIWMHYRISTPSDENAAKVLNDVREWLVKD